MFKYKAGFDISSLNKAENKDSQDNIHKTSLLMSHFLLETVIGQGQKFKNIL